MAKYELTPDQVEAAIKLALLETPMVVMSNPELASKIMSTLANYLHDDFGPKQTKQIQEMYDKLARMGKQLGYSDED